MISRPAGANGVWMPVPPALVHKTHGENAWLTEVRTYASGEQHARYHTPPEGADARISELIEVQRQAGLHYVHTQLGIPIGFVFLLEQISLRRKADATHGKLRASGGVVATFNRGTRRKGEACLGFTLHSGGTAAEGEARVRVVPSNAYERLRSRSDPSPMLVKTAPSRLQATQWNGVVAPDSSDPVLRDHSNDHLSGMAVIVAVEGELRERGIDRVDSLSAEFHLYLEHTPQPTFTVVLSTDGTFRALVEQNGRQCATIAGTALPTVEPSNR